MVASTYCRVDCRTNAAYIAEGDNYMLAVQSITINKKSIVGAGSVITKNVIQKSLALTRSNQITVKNYDLGFNKTYYGNVSILCKNQGACNMTKIYCDTGNCYIEAGGNNKGQLNNLIIDARNIQKGYKFEIK